MYAIVPSNLKTQNLSIITKTQEFNARTCLYIAYGSNLHPYRIRARANTARLLTTTKLVGWTLNFFKSGQDGSGKCNIVKATNEVVYTAIFKISKTDLKQLDIIEGVGKGYQVSTINVPDIGACAVYLAQDSYIDPNQKPYDWYKKLVIAGARYHSFPSAYIEAIETIKSKKDIDTNRAADNLSILHGSIF